MRPTGSIEDRIGHRGALASGASWSSQTAHDKKAARVFSGRHGSTIIPKVEIIQRHVRFLVWYFKSLDIVSPLKSGAYGCILAKL